MITSLKNISIFPLKHIKSISQSNLKQDQKWIFENKKKTSLMYKPNHSRYDLYKAP